MSFYHIGMVDNTLQPLLIKEGDAPECLPSVDQPRLTEVVLTWMITCHQWAAARYVHLLF